MTIKPTVMRPSRATVKKERTKKKKEKRREEKRRKKKFGKLSSRGDFFGEDDECFFCLVADTHQIKNLSPIYPTQKTKRREKKV